MKYGIVLFPSKEIQDAVNSYRKRYDTNYALIAPHVTIKSAFFATDEEIKPIVQELHKIAEDTQPIKLNIQKVSSFSPVNKVIYLKIEPTKQLLDLHSKLHSGILDEKPDYSFVPHITVGQNLSEDEHSDVLGSLKMRNFEHEETVDRFHLLYQLENGTWTVYDTFLLGKECN
ncbi:YjcG family protein [Metabacillus fastidiosus]|uniref:YjcG family protein n=1 Tax=Metabacillus fastidiosus TaxID=1458 RepID=UPI003D266C5A